MLLVYVAVLLEIASRIYLAAALDASFFNTGDLLSHLYTGVSESGVMETELGPDDRHLDVLMLGASVMESRYSNIDKRLEAALQENTGVEVRIFNLCMRAHTSRDSLFKYELLENKRFDLVILYHGINELRMNNCPAEMFRSDYSHVAWYRKIERVKAHREKAFLSFPCALEYLAADLLGKPGFGIYLSQHKPREEWLSHGADIKTAGPFRDNIRKILRLAAKKEEPVLLMTFASHIPDGYSMDRFKEGSLGYDRSSIPDQHKGQVFLPVEFWSSPENVKAGLKAHNKAVRELAEEFDGNIFVDQARLMPGKGTLFRDCCHLGEAGAWKFVGNIIGPTCAFLYDAGDETEIKKGEGKTGGDDG